MSQVLVPSVPEEGITPMTVNTTHTDPEISWPLVSACYNFSLEEIADIILTEPGMDEDLLFERMPRYVSALVHADYLWGRPIMHSLFSIDRAAAVKAITMAMEQNLEYCVGVDGTAFNETIKQFVGGHDPAARVKHNHLAATVFYWAWFGQSLDWAYKHVRLCKHAIDGAVDRYSWPFPLSGFTDLVVEAFQPVYGIEPKFPESHVQLFRQ